MGRPPVARGCSLAPPHGLLRQIPPSVAPMARPAERAHEKAAPGESGAAFALVRLMDAV